MKIYLTSVLVDNQAKALDFYTRVLDFAVKHDTPAGEYRWLTVVGKDFPDGPELLLEPSEHPAVKPFKDALMHDGIPAASFAVDDLDAEFDRLCGLGVDFTQTPMQSDDVRVAILNDTCGNLIQLVEMAGEK